MGGAFALALILVFFWMPESAYAREALNIDTADTNVSDLDLSKLGDTNHCQVTLEGKRSLEQVEHVPDAESASTERLNPWTKELMPYSGYVNHVSFWNTLVRPFYLLASPAVLWAVLLFTTCISWLVGISLTLSQIFSAPPYSFSVVGVGATNLSSFVASVLGTLTAGPLIDGLITKLSKKNGGIFGKIYRAFV
jgi:hypothetical protein